MIVTVAFKNTEWVEAMKSTVNKTLVLSNHVIKLALDEAGI